MPVEVRLPNVLRTHADGQPSVSVEGATRRRGVHRVGRAVPRSAREPPRRRGGLHKFVNVYRDDDDIRYLDGLDTKLADGDDLSILPAVAGGCVRRACGTTTSSV